MVRGSGFGFLSTEGENSSNRSSFSSVDGKGGKEKGSQEEEVEKGKRKRRQRRVLKDSDLSDDSTSGSNDDLEQQQQHDIRSNARRTMLPMSRSSISGEEEIVRMEQGQHDENPQRRWLIPELSDDDNDEEEALETVLGPFDRSSFLMPEGERAAMGLPTDIPNHLSEDSESILLASELKEKIEWLSNDGLRNFEKALRNLKSRIWSMHPTEAREEITSLKTFGLYRLVRGGIDIAKWCYRTLDNRTNENHEHVSKHELEVADLRLDPLDSRIDDRLHELRNLERSYNNSLDRTFEVEEIDDDDDELEEEDEEIEYKAEEKTTSTILLDPKVVDGDETTTTSGGSNNFFAVKRSEGHGSGTKNSLKEDVSLPPWKGEFRIRGETTQAVKKRRRRYDERGMGAPRGHSLLAAAVGQHEKRYYEPFKPFHVRYEERQQKRAAALAAMDSKAKKRGMGRRRGHQSKTRGEGASERRREQSVVVRHTGGTVTLTPKSSRYGIDEGGGFLLSEERQGEETQQIRARARHKQQRQQQMYRSSSPHRNRACLPTLRSLVEDLICLPTPTNGHPPSGGAEEPTMKPSNNNTEEKEVTEQPEIWNMDVISSVFEDGGKAIAFDCIYTQTLNDKIADLSVISLALEGCKQQVGRRMERNMRNEPGAAIPHILPFRRFIQYKEGSGLVLYQSDSNTMTPRGISSFNSTTQTGQNLLAAPEEQHQKVVCGEHLAPEVLQLLSQVADQDDVVLSDMHVVRACCSAMAVLSRIPISKRGECGFILGAEYLAERTLRNGGLGRALMQLDEKKQQQQHEAELLNTTEDGYSILELQCAVRCRLLEWFQQVLGNDDCPFEEFSRELLLELLDLYEKFPQSVAIMPAKVWEDDKSGSSFVISSPVIYLWCHILCSVDNYVGNHRLSSFWMLFTETITGAAANVENKGSVPVESVWSVVVFLVRLYFLIGNSSGSDATVRMTYNREFWRLVLLLLQAGPLSVGPPGIRKGKEVGGGISFTSPPESAFPLTYSCIQLERILVLGRYCPPSVSELSCIVAAALKLSSNETLWGAKGSTSGLTPYSSHETLFNDYLASTVVDSIIDIDDADLEDQDRLLEKPRNPPYLLQELLQHCRHSLHLSVMIPTPQCCSSSSSSRSSPSSPAFHPSLRLCGMAMEFFRHRLALESPGLNRRRLHSSLLRTMGELKSRNKAAASRGPLCLVMVMLRGGLLEGGVDEATELLCTSSVGGALQPDRKVMLMVPPALEIFTLLSPSNHHARLQLCQAVAHCLGELVDLFARSGVGGRLLDRPRAAVAVCSCCLYLMAFSERSKKILRIMIPPIGLMLGHLNCLGASAGKAVVGVAEHCAKVLWGGGVTFDKTTQEWNITPNDKPPVSTSMLHVEDEFGELGVDPTLLDLLEGSSCLPSSPSSSTVEESIHRGKSHSEWLSDASLLSLHFLSPLQRLVFERKEVKGGQVPPPNDHREIQQRHGGAPGRSGTTKSVDWSDIPLLRLQGIVSAATCATIDTTETAAAPASTGLNNIISPNIGSRNISSSLLCLHISLLQQLQQQQQSQHPGAHFSSLKLLGDYFQHEVVRLRSVGFFMCTFQTATVPEKSETRSALFKSIVQHSEWLLLTVWVETALDPLTFPPAASDADEVELFCRGFTRINVAASHTISDSERAFCFFIRDGLVPLAHSLNSAFMETSSELQGAFNAKPSAGEFLQFYKRNVGIRGGMTMRQQAQAKSEAVALERVLYLASVVRHLARLWGRAKELAKGGQGAEAQRIKSCVVRVVRSSLQAMYRGLFQWQEQSGGSGGCDSCFHYCCIIYAHLCYSYMGMIARSLPEALKGPPLSEMVGSLFGSLVSDPEGAPMLSSSNAAAPPYKQQHGCIPTPNHLVFVALHYLPDLLACFAQLQYNSRPISDWLAALSDRSIRWGVGDSRNSHGKELRRSFAAGLGGWKILQQECSTHNSTSADFMTTLEHIVSEVVPPIARIHQMRRSFMQCLDLPTVLLEECEHITRNGAGSYLSSSEVVVPVLHRSLLFLGLLFNSLGRGKVGVDDQELLQEAAPLLVPLYFIVRVQGLHGSHTAAALRAAVRILDAKEMGGMNRNLASIAAAAPQNGEHDGKNMAAPLQSLVFCFARALAILVASCFERGDSSTILPLREMEENRLKEAAVSAGVCIPQDRIKDEECFSDVCATGSVAWEEGTWCTSAELLCSVLVASSYQDIRQRTINSLSTRFAIDQPHADHVNTLSNAFFDDIKAQLNFGSSIYKKLLNWAAAVHELGIDINASSYHKHGEYILNNADLPGFNQEQQQALSWLVGNQKKRISAPQDLDWYLLSPDKMLIIIAILRLSVLLNQQRQLNELPPIALSFKQKELTLTCPKQWLIERPLVDVALFNEQQFLEKSQLILHVSSY